MIVRNQTDLDKALSKKGPDITINSPDITIDSPAGVWLTIDAWESSRVVARGSSCVVAWESSRVVARESSRVVARESSHVVAWESSRVVARESSRVEAWGSSHVVAWESSRVEARESSRVEAWGSSHVEARGSSHVEAWDSSHVEARDSSHVDAAKYVAVHLYSQSVTLSGGVVIDMASVDPTDFDTWCDLTGVTPRRGWITVYKAVDTNLLSGQGFQYPIGATVTDPKWQDNHKCGGGLHFSPTPNATREYFPEAARFLECRVRVGDVRCIDSSKIKAVSAKVIREVDPWSRKPIAAEVQP